MVPRRVAGAVAYHVIDPDDLEPMDDRPSEARYVSQAAGMETIGMRIYRPEPGEQIPLGYHYHDEQEEVFYVVEGEIAVETPEGTYDVATGQCFFAEPGSPHRAYNPEDADGAAEVLAVGAPSVDDGHSYEP